MKKIIISLPDDLLEKLDELIAKHSAVSRGDMIRRCIDDKFIKSFPDYIKLRPSPEQKIKNKIKFEEAKENHIVSKFKKIALALQGEIFKKDGVDHCTFNQYTETNGKRLMVTPITVPLEDLKDSDIETQYTDIMGYRGDEVRNKLKGYEIKCQ